MATLANKFMTLRDVAAATNDKATLELAEVLQDDNEVLDDIHFLECNNGSTHKSAYRTSLPAVGWAELNKGTASSKSTAKQVTDVTGMIEARSIIDERLCIGMKDRTGLAAIRKNEDLAFTEAMNQEFAECLFYGDPDHDAKKFLGFAPRYDNPEKENGEQLVDGGGTGSDNSSVWLIGWGPAKVFGLYPTNSKAGLEVKDLGLRDARDGDGLEYSAYKTEFRWAAGLCVRDWRYVGRLCNIDMSNLTSGSSAADLVKKLIILSERVKSAGATKQAFYCTRRVTTALRLQILDKSNVNLTFESVAGKKVLTFNGIPVRRCDALLETEAQVTGTFTQG